MRPPRIASINDTDMFLNSTYQFIYIPAIKPTPPRIYVKMSREYS
jgi:hypothetical protein